jgi:dTDP-4-amino-4,6-dideoxygalactose transaminase
MWIPPVHSPIAPADAVRSLTAGPDALHALERELLRDLSASRVLLTSSGTHALQVALGLALAATDADRRRVALPAYACYDVATAATAAGAPVAFYDLDPEHLVPDPASVAHAVERGAGVVVIANLFGFPVDWEPLRRIERETGAWIVEDAAQGIGTTWLGKPGGSLGDLSVLSFGRGKGWTGSGGGALLLRGRMGGERLDPLDAASTSQFVLAGKALAQWLLGRPALYGLPARSPGLGLGETHWREPTPATGMHPYQASLVRRSGEAARAEIVRRRGQAARLRDALSTLTGIRLPVPLGVGEASWLRLPVRMTHASGPLPRALARLGTLRAYPRVLPDLPQLQPLHEGPVPSCPGARTLVQELVTVPTHGRAPLAYLLDRLPGSLRDAGRI